MMSPPRHRKSAGRACSCCSTGSPQAAPSHPSNSTRPGAHRRQVAALAAHGVPPASDRIVDCGQGRAAGLRAMAELLADRPQFTAVLSCDDMVTAGALRAIAGAGFSIPDDISIVGHNDIPLAQDFNPPPDHHPYPRHLPPARHPHRPTQQRRPARVRPHATTPAQGSSSVADRTPRPTFARLLRSGSGSVPPWAQGDPRPAVRVGVQCRIRQRSPCCVAAKQMPFRVGYVRETVRSHPLVNEGFPSAARGRARLGAATTRVPSERHHARSRLNPGDDRER
ncbi:substrate-binding domain-containing protein [Streptomyces sp. GLT-R25]